MGKRKPPYEPNHTKVTLVYLYNCLTAVSFLHKAFQSFILTTHLFFLQDSRIPCLFLQINGVHPDSSLSTNNDDSAKCSCKNYSLSPYGSDLI